MSTTVEKFEAATMSLTGLGSIKDRLTDAFRNHLAFVDEDELPIELRDEFRAVTHAVTREPPTLRGEDALRATVRKLSNDEAVQVAYAVVYMFGAISNRSSASNTNVRPAKNGTNIVPLYVAEA